VKPPELTDYKLVQKIGSGGMGDVYKAIRNSDNKKVAIKFLDPEAAKVSAVLAQFKQEADILHVLNHHNVCGYIDRGVKGEFNYLVMELADGIPFDRIPMSSSKNTVFDELRVLSIEEYLKIFRDCFVALGYIHRQGLVHRDIKPANIILRGENYDPCLIDFGIAKYVSADDDLNLNPETMFTVVYASPEQLTNKPIDHLSDLFSFGVVMYEKLTGRLPFPGKKAMEVFVAQTKWNFPPPRQLNSAIPQKLEDIIMMLLSKDPVSRYPTAEMVLGDIDRIIAILKQSREGLDITPIIDDIRGVAVTKRGFKKLTVAEEQNMIKKIRIELADSRQRLRLESAKGKMADSEKIASLHELCNMLQADYERLSERIQMALGFKSQPLVIDKFNQVFTLDIISYEKRGVSFSINTIEQKVVSPDGKDIIVGKMNFSERAKRYFSINRQRVESSAWAQTNWFVGPYEEREFPVFIMVCDGKSSCPAGYDGFLWPREFLHIVRKFGWTGLGIVEKFRGVDRAGSTVNAEHRETVLFSQALFDNLDDKK
jgi:serine/threonine protein kinase